MAMVKITGYVTEVWKSCSHTFLKGISVQIETTRFQFVDSTFNSATHTTNSSFRKIEQEILTNN